MKTKLSILLEAPVLVHFGADKVENYLLVRLKQSEETMAGKS